MDKHTDTFTQRNIVELVNHAMVRPSYLSFNRACFVVGRIINKTPDEIISIYKGEQAYNYLVAEAMRVPQFPINKPTTGEVMVF